MRSPVYQGELLFPVNMQQSTTELVVIKFKNLYKINMSQMAMYINYTMGQINYSTNTYFHK